MDLAQKQRQKLKIYRSIIKLKIIVHTSLKYEEIKLAKLLINKLIDKHEIDSPPSRFLFSQTRSKTNNPELFIRILQENTIREFGIICYEAWERRLRNSNDVPIDDFVI